MQYAVPDLEELSIDQAALTRRRDRLTAALAGGRLRGAAARGHVLSLEPMAARATPIACGTALADRDVFVHAGQPS